MPQSHCLVKVVTCRSSKAEGSIDMTTSSACMKLCMRAVQEVQLVTLDTYIPQRQKWRKSIWSSLIWNCGLFHAPCRVELNNLMSSCTNQCRSLTTKRWHHTFVTAKATSTFTCGSLLSTSSLS